LTTTRTTQPSFTAETPGAGHRTATHIVKALGRRLKALSSEIVFWVTIPFSLSAVALIRLALPFVLVRMREIYSHRLGHFASESDMYLARRQMAPDDGRTLDLFYFDRLGPCNRQLGKMWARQMHIFWWVRLVDRANHFFPGHERHVVPWSTVRGEDWRHATPPFLKFTDAEKRRGKTQLAKILGEPHSPDHPLVCFFARDSRYLRDRFSQIDWAYHSYRDADIRNFLPAMEWLGELGFKCLRMGSAAQTPLTSSSPNVIDYASDFHDDFLDPYIYSQCAFQLSVNSGPDKLGLAFRKPTAFINTTPYLVMTPVTPTTPFEFFTPKLHFSHDKARALSVSEIVESGLAEVYQTSDYTEQGVEVLDNTPEDLLATAQEMRDFVFEGAELTPEDIRLRQAFWHAAKVPPEVWKHCVQPSPAFLRRNADQIL